MKKEMIGSLGLSAFCESMAMMLQAGIQTDEALSLLLEENESDGVLAQALRTAVEIVHEGRSVSEALSETGSFPEYFLHTLSLGERRGQMEDVFFHLSSYYAEQNTISQRLKSLVRYPAVMMVTVAVVLAVMLWKILPVFSGVYESMTGSVSTSAYGFIDISYGICWAAFILIALLLLLLLVCVLLWPTAGGGAFLRKFLEKLPLTAGIMETLGLYRFLVSVRVSLAAGESQDLAVEDGSAVTDCGVVKEKVARCLKLMEEGQGFAAAAYHVGLFEPVYGRMLLAGSRSGNMDNVMIRLSEILRDAVMEKVDRLSGLLEPVLSGTMMVAVGLSLLSVMLPLIGMMSSIG